MIILFIEKKQFVNKKKERFWFSFTIVLVTVELLGTHMGNVQTTIDSIN